MTERVPSKHAKDAILRKKEGKLLATTTGWESTITGTVRLESTQLRRSGEYGTPNIKTPQAKSREVIRKSSQKGITLNKARKPTMKSDQLGRCGGALRRSRGSLKREPDE